MKTLRNIVVTTALTMGALLGLLSAASADEDNAFDGRVTFATEGCSTVATFHPSGRPLSAVDNLGRTVGPIEKPATATLAFSEAGWIDVTLHRDGDQRDVTRRFTVPGPPPECEGTTTTAPVVTTTTQPDVTTTTTPDDGPGPTPEPEPSPSPTPPGEDAEGNCLAGFHDAGAGVCLANEEGG
jgi:hypothetical protein